ncbi:hypothetical protein [Legionella oakridgensis]|uniref:Uncharacterized protein n=2 Tax=Legionella oakridgensis TaxID=29423 RepID=W0B6Q1_9GAMM|nr:hypothetical protein [Legionella oakridgensis]AHE66228.1 hypothetical protein Loa_00659 [Legionella oakridgensis ATCC 33761 = DSM 21215]ETO93977.1 hypothetical protein LOR_93c25220 [Legionella oakridgensis RV-2-2007]KTD44774.1 hypothetical protein Loak_0024 [Legionella oakridgensis]STY16131.1 Uncharacterised protein [Legionella longbeachae]
MPVISERQFAEIKNQLKEKQVICEQIAHWKQLSPWLKQITSQPEFPPDFINELRGIRSAILSFNIDKNTLGLAVFYNELCKLLALPQPLLKPMDTNIMMKHIALFQRIRDYAKKVDEYITSLYEGSLKELDYSEFWRLLEDISATPEEDTRKQAKEKFANTIFSRLSQFNPKIYMDTISYLEEPNELNRLRGFS